MISNTEENYLKAIFKLAEKQKGNVSTNEIAGMMKTTAASVTDMLKRLSEKKLINYQKYKGVSLTEDGGKKAKNLIRKHRLWEVFLVEKLKFSWDQVHDLAEELEHIRSPLLTNRLESFLGNPKIDPHGDPIPDKNGNIMYHSKIALSELENGRKGMIVGVRDSSSPFLQYLDAMQISLGTCIEVEETISYDNSMKITIDENRSLMVSEMVANNLFVNPDEKS